MSLAANAVTVHSLLAPAARAVSRRDPNSISPCRVSFSSRGNNSVLPLSGKFTHEKKKTSKTIPTPTPTPMWKLQCVEFANGIDCKISMLDDDTEYLFQFTPEDMASEESIWDMYERWIVFEELSSSPEEKKARFETFKSSA